MSGSILSDNKNLVAIVTWALLDPVLPLTRMFVKVALDAALERCLVLQEFPGRQAVHGILHLYLVPLQTIQVRDNLLEVINHLFRCDKRVQKVISLPVCVSLSLNGPTCFLLRLFRLLRL